MKVLRKKLKKVHGFKKFIYYFSLIFYIITFSFFILSILKLKGIETILRIIVLTFFGLWFLIYILCGLLTMITKKNKTFIFITIVTILLCPVFSFASYYIDKAYNSLKGINNNELLYTSNLIALKETDFNSNLVIGMIETEDDIEGNILAKKLIKSENLSNTVKNYEDYHSMISDLYKGKIGACFVSSNYSIIFNGENFEDESNQNAANIDEKVKVVYEYSEKRENQDVLTLESSKKKTLTEPFTALIMGVDSTIDGLTANQAFNGDTLILVTFNPNTLTATMFSIPRDTYVPIACNHNRYAKINSSAAYGSSCVINTVQQLTNIDIDYYVKINFTGVVNLVDALGGVTVEVEEPDFYYDNAHIGQVCEQDSQRRFGKNLICMHPGLQTLNGEQALAYARCRHLYATSDIARNQHQQAIIEAMANKIKTINSLNDFENLLNTVSKNIETNMTPEQILSFYSVGKDMLLNSTSNSLSIKKTHLAYYNLAVWLPQSAMYTSALGYYPQSLEAITKLMRQNLGQEAETPIKTFSISYNEEYTTPIVGQGLTGGATLGRVQSFIGSTQEAADAWCSENNITCDFNIISDIAPQNTIIEQSAHEGELLKSITSITFTVSNGQGTQPNEPGDDDEEENNNNENNKDDEEDNNEENNQQSEIPGLPSNPNSNDNQQSNEDDPDNNNDSPEDNNSNNQSGSIIPGTP